MGLSHSIVFIDSFSSFSGNQFLINGDVFAVILCCTYFVSEEQKELILDCEFQKQQLCSCLPCLIRK